MKPSLEEFIAALPECPDCDEKLHRFAYCPGRSRIRSEAMQDPTTEKGTTSMSNTITIKQGQPSKPGEVVDTSMAKVIPPPSAEVQAHAEAKGDDATVPKNVRPKATKAPKAKAAKGKTKAAAKTRGNGSGPAARLTAEWTGKDKKDVKVKDRVRTSSGIVIDVIGRWTKKTAKGNVPMVTGHIVSLPTGAASTDKGGLKVGNRQSAVAADCTHVTKVKS